MLDANFKKAFMHYEKEGFQIGKALIQKVTLFTEELERKYQIFFEVDFDIFWEYLTREKNTLALEFNEEFNRRMNEDLTKRIPLEPIDAPQNLVDLKDIHLIVY